MVEHGPLLWMMGNSRLGQLGTRGHEAIWDRDAFEGCAQMDSVACGADHTVLVCGSHVWTTGWSADGQTGHDRLKQWGKACTLDRVRVSTHGDAIVAYNGVVLCCAAPKNMYRKRILTSRGARVGVGKL